MELKEVIEVLQGDYFSRMIDAFTNNEKQKQALQTAISHLETLQKVKEVGRVKRKNTDSGLCYCMNNDSGLIECVYCKNKLFNEALDLKDAELAWKLEGLEEAMNFVFIDYALNGQGNRNLTKSLTSKIQELILGKKEG